MSAATRNYEWKDFSYLLINTSKVHCDETDHENISGLDNETYSLIRECCKNKRERYKSFVFLLTRISYSKELLSSFLKLNPVIREVRYDYFYFSIGANDWKFSTVSNDTADLFLRLSKITADGRKQFTGAKLFLTGKIDEILRRLSDGISDQHCCKAPKVKLSQSANAEHSEIKKSFLYNNSIWYIKDLRSETVHEKSCPMISKIPDEEIDGVKRLEPDSRLCPCCCKASLIRPAIGESTRYLNAYVRFFETLRIKNDRLRQLVFENKTELSFPSPDTNVLRAKVNDDTWLIERHPDSTVTLWHNDYQILDDNTRYFTGGYHVQIDKASVNLAAGIMCNYSWAEHVAKRYNIVPSEVPQTISNNQAKIPNKKTSGISGFIRRLLLAMHRMFMRRG